MAFKETGVTHLHISGNQNYFRTIHTCNIYTYVSLPSVSIDSINSFVALSYLPNRRTIVELLSNGCLQK